MGSKWIGGALVLAAAALPAQHSRASSHREAPFIARMPKVDGTDFYMFNSYQLGRSAYVTLIANYQPLQAPYGGPNYFTMDPDAIYEIHIDSDGDAAEDLTFQFDFSVALQASGSGIKVPVGAGANQKMIAIPFSNANLTAPITTPAPTSQNVLETYSVRVIRGDRRTGTGAAISNATGGSTTFNKPLDYIGQKSLGNAAAYNAYAAQFIYDIDIPMCTPPAGQSARLFVGQRAEGFPVNLGQVFDLVNATTAAGQPEFQVNGPRQQNKNIVGGSNVTSIALEVPASCLYPTGDDEVIGGWTTASVRQARVINPDGTFALPSREGGPWVQVSRLGLPLINEVVIGLPDKDKFNGSEPINDGTNFADYVTHPTVPYVLEAMFGGAGVTAPTNVPRLDLVQNLLIGVVGVNVNGGGTVPADMLRLNTTDALPILALGARSELGAVLCLTRTASGVMLDTGNAGCDPQGFPNGRRPGDDVTDIALNAMMGYLAGMTAAPNWFLYSDGATFEHEDFPVTFPYLNAPLPGSP